MSAYIESLKTQLANVDEQINAVLANGESYSIRGAMTTSKVKLSELRTHRATLAKRLRAALGLPSAASITTTPRFF